jgi:ornithine cyclodeaminase
VRLGEFQHLPEGGGRDSIVAIGDVLSGKAAGRRLRDDITVFDSSGLALQDLFMAKAILDRAVAGGLAIEIDT